MAWSSLPDDLRAQQDYEPFRQGLQPGFSLDTSVFSALDFFDNSAIGLLIDIYHTIPYHDVTFEYESMQCI